MVHKNLNRPETSLTPFDLLNKNRVYYNIKRQGIITVGARPLPLAAQTRSCWGVPDPNPAGNEYGKLEVIYVFANIPYLLVVHRPHKLGGHNYR